MIFHEEYGRGFSFQWNNCKIGFYLTWIRINGYRRPIAFDFNFCLVANFCVRPSCFFTDMKALKGDDCIKRVEFRHLTDVFLLLHVWKQKYCVLNPKKVRFDIRFYFNSNFLIILLLLFTFDRQFCTSLIFVFLQCQ